MNKLNYSLKRLDSALLQVDELLTSEFPYPSPRKALEIIRGVFLVLKSNLQILAQALLVEKGIQKTKTEEDINQYCLNCLVILYEYMPRMGFLLRSTNVRNAFEVVGPLNNLARKMLGSSGIQGAAETHVLLSSEWHYFPFTYPMRILRDFVLIGLPASESANPLLLPLAGHELGHALWERADLGNSVKPKVTDLMADLVLESDWDRYKDLFSYAKPCRKCPKCEYMKECDEREPKKPQRDDVILFLETDLAYESAMAQSEECFADFVGLRIFGRSFLLALAYLLSPGSNLRRPQGYPITRKRIDYLLDAASSFGTDVPEDYTDNFVYTEDPGYQKGLDGKRLELADQCIDSIVKDLLIGEADKMVNESGIQIMRNRGCLSVGRNSGSGDEERVYSRFKKVVPAEKCRDIAAILNAAWRAYENLEELWPDLPDRVDKGDVLKDLVLKSIEITEVERIVGGEGNVQQCMGN